MTATLTAQVDQIASAVRRVCDLAEQLAAAAVNLTEEWDQDAVHDMARASFAAQDAADQVRAALSRLEEAVR